MIINHNIPSMFAHRQLTMNGVQLHKTSEKLASGLRINHAGDDAAGLAISEKMRAQVRGLTQANRNTLDGISFVQTTEGYLDATTSLIQRIRVLAIQSSNGIYTAEDRNAIQVEVNQLIDEIDRVASHAQFNTINMLTGRFAQTENGAAPASMWIHLGANMDQRERLFIGTMTAAALGVRDFTTGDNIQLTNANDANIAIGIMDSALAKVSAQRADLGAYQNRLEFASKAIMIGIENLQASESRIRDTDMAEQSVNFSRDMILNQTATSMLAHSNTTPQMVLRLIQ